MKTFAAHVRLVVCNDLQLLWRNIRFSDLFGVTVVVILVVLFHFVPISIYLMVRANPSLQIEALIWWLLTFVMLGAAISAAISLLYERADFDLLLSSPVSFRAVLFARLISMAAATFLSIMLFAPPVIDTAIIFFSPRYLASFATWALAAVLIAGLGMSFTLVLVHVFGAGRARTISQILSALLGSSVLIVLQLPNILFHIFDKRHLHSIYRHLVQVSAFTLPARAGRGEPMALAELTFLAAIALVLTAALLAHILVFGRQEIAALPGRTLCTEHRHWTSGLVATSFRKDIRLIARNPLHFRRVLTLTITLACFAITFSHMLGIGVLAPIAFIMGVEGSGILAWISISREECWDLIQMSPLSETRLRAAKLTASMIPPFSLVVSLCLVLVLVGRPWLAILTLVVSFACGAGPLWLLFSKLNLLAERESHRSSICFYRLSMTYRTIIYSLFCLGGGGGLILAAIGERPIISAVLLVLTLLFSIGCFAFIKLEEVVYQES